MKTRVVNTDRGPVVLRERDDPLVGSIGPVPRAPRTPVIDYPDDGTTPPSGMHAVRAERPREASRPPPLVVDSVPGGTAVSAGPGSGVTVSLGGRHRVHIGKAVIAAALAAGVAGYGGRATAGGGTEDAVPDLRRELRELRQEMRQEIRAVRDEVRAGR